MPVDDIIEEVSAERAPDYHATTRRPSEATDRPRTRSHSVASSREVVPTTRSPRHSPRLHYEMLKVKTEVNREEVEYLATVFGFVTGVIRLL